MGRSIAALPIPFQPNTTDTTCAVLMFAECMRWHLRNHNCKQILLGISHDAGYAPFLDEVIPEDRERITILEGPPTVQELSATGIKIIPFNNIFRTEKLVDRSATSWAGITSIAPLPPLISPPTSIVSATTPTPTVKKTTTKPVWTPSPRGLDPPINVNATVLERIKRRTTNNKLCNNHYLRGPCAKGDECTYDHTRRMCRALDTLCQIRPWALSTSLFTDDAD